MKPIHTYSNWCDIDRLDEGVDLSDETRVRVRWPDGQETVEMLRVERTSYETSDMGSPYTVPDHRAFIERRINGVSWRTYLRPTKGKVLLERLP